MSNRIKNNLKNLVGQTLNQYYSKVKPTISDLRYKQEYQNRIIECMVGEVDDNYITTPETDNPIVKLEHSKEGLVKVPTIKGKTILVDSDGNETDTPAEGCRLVSVGEEEDNKLIILSKSKNLFDVNKIDTLSKCKILNKNNENGEVTISYNGNYANFGINLTEYIDVLIGKTFRASYSEVINTNSDANLSIQLNGRYKNGTHFYLYPSTTPITITDNMETLTFAIFSNNTAQELQGTFTIKKVQLEIDELRTNFVPCKQHKTEILLDEPLRRYDYIEGNKLYKNCKNLKIQSNFTIYNSQIWNDYYGVIMTIRGDFSDIKADRVSGGTTYFDKFIVNYNKWLMVADYQMQEMNMYILSPNLSSYINLFCKIPKTEVDSYDGSMNEKIEQWFNENAPMLDIIYQTTPIIEELPNGITLQGFDDTTMYIENSITPTVSYGYNALIPYKEELLNQKEEVETNTLDIEQNIIPYLMDMEFNLMLMEDNE